MWTATALAIARCREPTHPNAAWFARGSGHNEKAQYSERPEDYVNNLDRLKRKWETARNMVPAPVAERSTPGAKVGIIAYGSSHWAVVESVDQLQQEQGIAADYLRLRAYPFSAAVKEFIAAHERVYVVDQNRDAQMLQLIKMDIATRRRGEAAQHSPLRRTSAGSPFCHRQHCVAGAEVMATTRYAGWSQTRTASDSP